MRQWLSYLFHIFFIFEVNSVILIFLSVMVSTYRNIVIFQFGTYLTILHLKKNIVIK